MRYLPTTCIAILLAMVSLATAQDDDNGWTPLFNGENLEGWHTLPGGEWEVVDGVIVGTSPRSERQHGLLVTDEEYDDFDVRLKFRVVSGDSGFYFRVTEIGGNHGVNGFQVEVDSTLETGGLYETGGRGWVTKPDAAALREHYTPGEWSDLNLTAEGGHIVVHINGYKTAELTDDPGRSEGRIALQLHGGQEMHVQYKDIEIRIHPAE